MWKSLRNFAFAVVGAVTVVVALVEPPAAAAEDTQSTALVKTLYAAFAKGDVPAILERLAEGVEWEVIGPASACPCYGRRTGKPAVEAFFKEISERHDYKAFEPREFHTSKDTVLVIGRQHVVLKANGKAFASDWVHVFRIEGGKVNSFREFTDTASYAQASSGK
jgi:hypothetical protein